MKAFRRTATIIGLFCLCLCLLHAAVKKGRPWYEARCARSRKQDEKARWERLQETCPAETLRQVLRESPREFQTLLEDHGIKPEGTAGFFRTAALDGDRYKLSPGPKAKAFNLRFRIVVKDAEAGGQAIAPVVRVALNYQSPADYYRVHLGAARVSIAKVEAWQARPVGISSSGGLADRQHVEVVIKKREDRIAVVLDGITVAKAYDDSLAGGQIGVWLSSPAIVFEEVRCQPIGEVYFSDDFMRGSEQASEWETVSGRWRLNTLDNVSMSSNAFSFEGKASDGLGLVVVGHWFWDDYVFKVACQKHSDEPIGVCFCYRDQDNYHLVRWGRAGKGKPDVEKVQLLRVRQGKKVVLAEEVMELRTHQWYELRAHIADGTARISVDDNLILRISDNELSFGRVGLYVEGSQGALFDDVLVQRVRRFEDELAQDCPGMWTALGGNWRWHGAKGGVMRVDAAAPAKAVAGNVRWQDYELAADVIRPDRGEVGLCFNYQDEANHYVVRMDAKDAFLTKVIEAQREDLAIAKDVKWHEGTGRLKVVTNRGSLAAFFEKDLLFEAIDTDLRSGKVGLYASCVPEAEFDNVRVDFLRELRPIYSAHEVFSGERSMANWAAAQSDWHEDDAWVNGRWTSMRWHRADVFGPHEIVATVNDSAPRDFGIHFLTAAQAPKAKDGYVFSYSRLQDQVEVTLHRQGDLVAKSVPRLPSPARRIRLARRGACLMAYADNKPILGWVDPAPLPGTRVAYAAYGIEIPPEDVQIQSDNVQIYTFGRAPVDWRLAAGQWGVTNRWQCDPRWSFFSGRPGNARTKLAAMWNKRELSGDVCLEFAAGIQMDRDRGSRYEYARDINATICADGQDLTSGYSFVFGGWENRYTRILRRNEVVAQATRPLIPRDIHRYWFYVKVEKKGPDLKFWIDNQLALAYTDARPLAGRRLALWTYDVGIMLARVRVSSPGRKKREWPVASNPSAQRCCYDGAVTATAPRPASLQRVSPGLRQKVASLVTQLSDAEDGVRWNAAMALAQLGEPAAPAVIDALSTSNEQARWKAEAALRKMGRVAMPSLVEALRDSRVGVRRSVAYLLGEMRDEGTIPDLARTLGDADEDVRWKAAVALAGVGLPCVPEVLKQLVADGAEARKCAAWILQQVQSPQAIPSLIAALDDPDRDVAWKAAIALKGFGPQVVAPLATTQHEHDRSRRYVLWIMKELPGADAKAAHDRLLASAATTETCSAGAPPVSTPALRQRAFSCELSVTSEPANASAFLDGEYVGVTPATVSGLAPGAHALKFVRRGYLAWVEPVLVLSEAGKVHAVLTPKACAQLAITSDPEGVDVFLDGKLVGATPLTLAGLLAGTYRVRLRKDNYAPWHTEVTAAADQTTKVHGGLTLKAESHYLSAIEKEPRHAAHYSELAHLYALQNRFAKMRDALAKAIELVATGKDTSGASSRVLQEFGKIYGEQFTYGGAQALRAARTMIEALLEDEIRKRPRILQTHTLLGRLYLTAQKTGPAIAALSRTVRLFPHEYEPHMMLGQAYLAKYQGGDWRAARTARSYYEKALRYCRSSRHRKEIQKRLRQLPR